VLVSPLYIRRSPCRPLTAAKILDDISCTLTFDVSRNMRTFDVSRSMTTRQDQDQRQAQSRREPLQAQSRREPLKHQRQAPKTSSLNVNSCSKAFLNVNPPDHPPTHAHTKTHHHVRARAHTHTHTHGRHLHERGAALTDFELDDLFLDERTHFTMKPNGPSGRRSSTLSITGLRMTV
jgi:hypothetical protein